MKKLASIVLLALVLCVNGYSQGKPKVNAGIMALDGGKLDVALERLTYAVDNQEMLKEKDVVKAYYHLTRAYLAVARDSNMMSQYPDAANKAYEAYAKTKELDTDKKYDKLFLINQIEEGIWANLFNQAATAYGAKDYKAAQEKFGLAASIKKEDLNTNLMLGYSFWMLQDTSNAQDSWQTVTSLYAENTPEEPNQDVATAYLLLASTYDMQKNATKALEFIDEGRTLFPDDEDLARTELGIYQKSPELLSKAVEKFEAAIEANPDDYDVQVAYGSLLYQNGQEDKAIEVYKNILKNQPDNKGANIQLGAHFVNKAAEVSNEKMNLKKESEIDEADKRIKGLLEQGFPYMKKMNELEPDQPEWINQLVSMAYYLDMSDEEIKKYEDMQKKVMGN